MKKPSNEYSHFRGTIRGWAFCNNEMLKRRIAAGEEAFKALTDPDEVKQATDTLNTMRGALQGIPL